MVGDLSPGSTGLRVRLGALSVDTSGSLRYAYFDGNAPIDDGTKWDPVELTGRVDDEGFLRTERATGAAWMPAVAMGCRLLAEVPLRAIRIDEALVTADETCVGRLSGRDFVPGATLSAFIKVEDAQDVCTEAVASDLCGNLAGVSCDEPMTTWPNQPNARCDEEGCVETCVADCNAWRMEGRITAGAVTGGVGGPDTGFSLCDDGVPARFACARPDAGVEVDAAVDAAPDAGGDASGDGGGG